MYQYIKIIRYKRISNIYTTMQNYKRLNQKKEHRRINNQLDALTRTLLRIRSKKYTIHSKQMELNARGKIDNIRSQLQLSKIQWT